MNRVSLQTLILIFALAALGSSAASQTHIVPDDEDDSYSFVVQMHNNDYELAEEYVEILEDLRDIISDYSDYRDELSATQRSQHQLSLDVFVRGLKNEKYNKGHNKLLADLNKSVETLLSLEAQHSEEQGSKRPKCCQIVRNLRREFQMLVELLEDYQIQVETRRVVTVTLQELQQELISKLEELQITIDGEDLGLTIELDKFDELARLKDLEIEQMADVQKAIKELVRAGLLSPPQITQRTPPERVGIVWPSAPQYDRGTKKQYATSAVYPGRGMVIKTDNSFGDLMVAGWSKDKMAAKLIVQVDSDVPGMKDKFFDGCSIETEITEQEMTVTARLPKISDPGFELLSSKLVVMVPYGAPIICQNSYGQITASELEASVTINGDHSHATVSRVTGKVTANNVSGTILVTDVTGEVNATVSHGTFVATDCVGSIVLTGKHYDTKFVGCTGSVNISGLGTASITDHYGDLTVNNSRGSVKIDNLEGNLWATNSFKPLIVRRVSGSVSLTNRHGEIRAEGIGGDLTAALKGGKMTGVDLRGPINLTIENTDEVNLYLTSRLTGNSTITANKSSIFLSLSDRTDVQLMIDISQGTLKARSPVEIDRSGSRLSAEGRFGRATGTLSISGNGLSVYVNESR